MTAQGAGFSALLGRISIQGGRHRTPVNPRVRPELSRYLTPYGDESATVRHTHGERSSRSAHEGIRKGQHGSKIDWMAAR